MVVVVEHNASEQMIEGIIKVLNDFGFDVHRSTGMNQTVLGAIGVQPDFDLRQLEVLPGVARVYRVTEPYKLAGRSFHPENSEIPFGENRTIGGREIVVMAGPCSVESEKQIFTIAELVAKSGATFLRGGAYKPRTSPYAFQGLGVEGLKLLRRAADAFGLKTVTEVMDSSQIESAIEYADIIQVGARNMQNYTFLRELGKISTPVMLKRGLSATFEEWLMSAEYILSGGNKNLMLCERGIRTFEPSTRNTMDIGAIPMIHSRSHLPVIADPSHGIGIRTKVMPMARAAVAAGADGVIVEVHHDPDHAKSDGAQSLYPEQFAEMMTQLRAIAEVIGRSIA
ncbi:MAG: 3-deoxy-7-phosphoheptulonate synthase [Acidobacteriota bacterium]